MSIDATLLRIIVCPECHARLEQVEVAGAPEGTGELACTGCTLVYPVRDDIPVLLVDEARRAG